jgi:hypothetical protein
MRAERRTWTAGFIMVGYVFACAACGEGSGGGPSGVSSGITPTKPVSTLTPAETTQLCKTVDDGFKDPAVTDGLCKFTAVFAAVAATLLLPNATDAQLQMACTMGYSECKKPQTGSQTATSSCKAPPASCTVTVGEVEKCLSDMKVALANLGAAVPACSTLTKATLGNSPPDTDGLTKQPDSCETIDQKCPGLVPEPNLPD